MNPLTMAELRLRHAQLTEKASRLEATWRTLPTGAKSLQMGKQVKALQGRADDYARLIETVNADEVRKALERL